MKMNTFMPEHIQLIKNHGNWALDDTMILDKYLCRPNFSGAAYTVLDESGPICFGGIVTYWKGLGEAFLIHEGSFLKKPKEAYRIVKTMLYKIAQDLELRRIEATCVKLNNHCRFLEKLGFKLQGERRKYYPDGADAFLYEIVKEDNGG